MLLGPCSEGGIERSFRRLKAEVNANPDCHLELGFSEELAHLIYAGADYANVYDRIRYER